MWSKAILFSGTKQYNWCQLSDGNHNITILVTHSFFHLVIYYPVVNWTAEVQLYHFLRKLNENIIIKTLKEIGALWPPIKVQFYSHNAKLLRPLQPTSRCTLFAKNLHSFSLQFMMECKSEDICAKQCPLILQWGQRTQLKPLEKVCTSYWIFLLSTSKHCEHFDSILTGQ